jgi:hypothetical protein
MASAINLIPSGLGLTRFDTPQVLRIERYSVRAGTAVALRNLHKQVAKAMLRWDCPHPCLAGESIAGPGEIWTLTGYGSAADHLRVCASMQRNQMLQAALDRLTAQMEVLAGVRATLVADHRGGQGRAWRIGYGHYLIVSKTSGEGSAYATAGDTRLVILSTRTRKEAEARAAAVGPDARILSIRAAWGMPSRHWVSLDPDFWSSSPVAKHGAARVSSSRKLTSFGTTQEIGPR